MLAELVRAVINPWCVDEAGRAVEQEAIPDFLATAGAMQGYWMANRSTGDVLVVTMWSDEESLRVGWPSAGFGRTGVAERIGLRIRSIQTMDVIGSHECEVTEQPVVRWARATWAEAVLPDRYGRLQALYRMVVPDQARSRGFCGSYWIADLRSGRGLALSLWDQPADLADGEPASTRRRSSLEGLLGCRIDSISELEALGVAAPRPPRQQGRTDADHGRAARAAPDPSHLGLDVFSTTNRRERSRLRELGTTLDRSPGSLLTQQGTDIDEVVVMIDGEALAIHGDGVRRLGRGDHVGGPGILDRRPHEFTLVATSGVRVHVLSRAEFAALVQDLPAVAARLRNGGPDPLRTGTSPRLIEA
jgi:hypothetical protein